MSTTLAPVVTGEDIALAAHHAAVNHIEAVYEYYRLTEEADEEQLEQLGNDPAYAPFCSCPDCDVREALHAALPIIARGIISGQLDPRDLLGDEIEGEVVA